MNADELFAAALECGDAAERAALLDRECAASAPLRAEVRSLLAAHDGAEQFMQTEAMPEPEPPVDAEPAGARIGRYKLLEQIGEGGFGTVWLAEQEEPVRRRVALKIIKLGMDTKEVVARFEAERQALALMDHPSIARVFDGGATETGRPYFVMELVRGVPITKYCDEHRLTVKERLELFIQVCQAVQHAHQKGIIHRDIKPNNVLVSVVDDQAVPKVIDFGIAKATAQRLTEKTVFTRFNQFIGTPAYMSPEQAGANREDIDTRSDIYSLGVLLYELLTGRTPFDSKKLLEAGYEAILKTIREQEPPKPSTRLTGLTNEDLSTVAASRRIIPAKLGRAMRGELDWIVMKCLEKDRSRRYDTANGLALDLSRLLNQEPVLAAPPSSAYRLQRFARRHRVAMSVASAFVVVLLSGIVTSAWQAWRANHFAREANVQRRIATNESARANLALADSEKARKKELSTAYANSITLAWREWQNGDVSTVRRVLDDCAPELHEWEWHHLQRLANSALWTAQARIANREAQSADISSLRAAFTGDDRMVALFGTAVQPALFDTRTGQRVFEWSSKEGKTPNFTSFSTDGRWLLVGMEGSGCKFIDTKDTEQPQELAKVWKRLIRPQSEWISVISDDTGELQLTGIPVDLFGIRDETWQTSRLMDLDRIGNALYSWFDQDEAKISQVFGDQAARNPGESAAFADEWNGRMILWVARSTRVRDLIKATLGFGRPIVHVERVGSSVFLVTQGSSSETLTSVNQLRVTSLTKSDPSWEPRLPLSVFPARLHFDEVNGFPRLLIAGVSLDRTTEGMFEVPLRESRAPDVIRHPLDDGNLHASRIVGAYKYLDGPFYGALDVAFDVGAKALVTAGQRC